VTYSKVLEYKNRMAKIKIKKIVVKVQIQIYVSLAPAPDAPNLFRPELWSMFTFSWQYYSPCHSTWGHSHPSPGSLCYTRDQSSLNLNMFIKLWTIYSFKFQNMLFRNLNNNGTFIWYTLCMLYNWLWFASNHFLNGVWVCIFVSVKVKVSCISKLTTNLVIQWCGLSDNNPDCS
jgi:hypothetical protein